MNFNRKEDDDKFKGCYVEGNALNEFLKKLKDLKFRDNIYDLCNDNINIVKSDEVKNEQNFDNTEDELSFNEKISKYFLWFLYYNCKNFLNFEDIIRNATFDLFRFFKISNRYFKSKEENIKFIEYLIKLVFKLAKTKIGSRFLVI